MAVNDLTFNQLSTALNAIHNQATGKTGTIATVTTGDFVSVAQSTLKQGYDPVMNAISQVLGKTMFAVRPYNRKFAGLQMSNQRWGYVTRKINIADKAFEDDSRTALEDGQSVDMYTVNKPNILETHLYGQNVYQKSMTIFKDQLDCAFRSPEEFAQFLTLCTTNASDMLEQAREELARMTVANFIGGKVQYDTGNVVHLLAEYNAMTGLSLTATTVFLPANFKPFMEFVYARCAEISSYLTERSSKYHMNVTNFGGTVSEQGVWSGGTDKTVMRHTPAAKQKVYLYSPTQLLADSAVKANQYHENLLKLTDYEAVNYWQNINDPAKIKVTPVCLTAGGTAITPNSPVTKDKVFGIIFDEDAMGYTLMNQWTATTPFNAKGGYSNWFFHETARYFADYTENAVVLLLD